MWQALIDGLSALSDKWAVVPGIVIISCLACGFGLLLPQVPFKEKTIPWRSFILLSGFFGVSVILRLAFVAKIFVPPYFDSVEHYRITKELVTALGSSTLLETIPTLTPNYYHLGFHILASLLAFGLHADPMEVILVLGQVILAAIPIPIYILIRHETQSDVAAFFGMLLAGFGWYMPGFAVNWGKYPALAGLLALEIVLAIAYLIAQVKSPRYPTVLIFSLLLGIVVSTLIHTRTLAVVLLSIVSWSIAGKMKTLPKPFHSLLLGIFLVGVLFLGTSIQGEPLLNLALDPYLGDGIRVTWTVLALSPFALIKFPRGFYFSLLFVLCVFAALFIPIDIPSPGLENQTLLDRPFVEMVLYLPFSILAGLGLAGILQGISNVNSLSEKMRLYPRVFITVLLVGSAGLMPIVSYNYYPSDCCNLVGYDDTVVFEWIDRNLPSDALILIAATQLNVLPTGPSESLVGTDAGIWIPVLTGRNISLVSFDTDFRSASTLIDLCQKQVGYIYSGGRAHSFNAMQLQAITEWYERMLFLPNAQLYQLTGCFR